jgi:hypothetical protein
VLARGARGDGRGRSRLGASELGGRAGELFAADDDPSFIVLTETKFASGGVRGR